MNDGADGAPTKSWSYIPPAFFVERHKYDRCGKPVRRQLMPHGNGGGCWLGVAVDARADAGKGHAGQLMFGSQVQAIAVAAGQQLRLAFVAAVPDRAHGVDDVRGRQPVLTMDRPVDRSF